MPLTFDSQNNRSEGAQVTTCLKSRADFYVIKTKRCEKERNNINSNFRDCLTIVRHGFFLPTEHRNFLKITFMAKTERLTRGNKKLNLRVFHFRYFHLNF